MWDSCRCFLKKLQKPQNISILIVNEQAKIYSVHFKISARKRESEQQVYIKILMIKIAAKWGDGDHKSS